MTKERIVWIDALNIMACAGVLLLHCTNKEVHAFSGTPSANWYIGLFTHSFVMWPVNVFFMLSGFTLMRKSLIHENRQDAWGGGKNVLHEKMEAAWRSAHIMESFLHVRAHIHALLERRANGDDSNVGTEICPL